MSPPDASLIEVGWPYVGLVAAIVVGILLATPALRGDRSLPAVRDPAWLAWLALVLYVVHQFEEYGVDATGSRHAFPAELCGAIGFESAACPIPGAFYVVVNVGTVWGTGLLGALLARRFPAAGLTLLGAIAANAVVHIVGSVAAGRYAAGLATAVLLFVPFTAWVAGAVFVRGGLGGVSLALVLLGGVVQHAVLLGSVAAFARGVIGEPALIAAQLLNTAVPLALLAAFGRWRGDVSRSRSRRRAPSAGG